MNFENCGGTIIIYLSSLSLNRLMYACIIMIIQPEDICHTCVSSANNRDDFILKARMDWDKKMLQIPDSLISEKHTRLTSCFMMHVGVRNRNKSFSFAFPTENLLGKPRALRKFNYLAVSLSCFNLDSKNQTQTLLDCVKCIIL